MMKFSAIAFVCLICVTVLLNTAESRPPLRCKCLRKEIYSGRPIPRNIITSLDEIPAGPHCRNDQIIVTMKKKTMCLDPKADWVIALRKSWKTTTQAPKSKSRL